jgi:ComF family protein
LKFNRDLYPGKLFAKLLLDSIRQRWYLNHKLPEVIIPVPLHSKRHRQRGYNQSLEICLPVARTLKIPLDLRTCKRVRNTPAQARLNKTQRSANVQNAFVAQECRYEHVALVDDVVTTGSTISALSYALLSKGVKQIDVWCICRA